MSEERSVRRNARTFLIDGRPDVFLCADVPYFRVPRPLWADRVARARRAGMNTVETAVPWAFHEPAPGVFDWEGDRGFEAFLAECERQEMYVIVQPDPYALRARDEPYLRAVDRWFDHLAPILGRRQWTRGGNVILVRVGDEYARGALLRRGVDVPLITGAGAVDRIRAHDPAGVEYDSWRRWAEGAYGYSYDALLPETGRLTDSWRAARRVASFARTFKEVLTTGELRRGLPAGGGLRVSETRTPQRGAILWVDNPDEETVRTGSVPPYLPEVTLAPRTLLPWVHDAPIGASERYLSAYAGLVKSDARVLHAHVLPDPYEGARVYVYGAPGERAEVVLFNGGERARAAQVVFAPTPRVTFVGPSQVVALSTEHAGRTWIHPADGSAPVVVGPDDVREHGAHYFVGEFPPGQTHTVHLLRADGSLAQVTVDAPALPAPPALSGWQPVEGGPLRRRRATFTLGAPPDTATPLLVRLDGGGEGVPRLNGHDLGRYGQAGPRRDYYAPEPWLNVGQNVLVLAESDGSVPAEVSLVWDKDAAAVVRVSYPPPSDGGG